MFTIIAPLPDNLTTALEPYRQKYDPQVHVIPPHIEVLPSFDLSIGLLQALHDHLIDVGEGHAPIRVSLAGWDVYDEADYQIRLPVIAGKQELIALHDDLTAGPLGDYVGGAQPYYPHIVVGRFSRQTELDQARHALRGFEPQFVFRVSHLILLYREKPTWPWQPQKNIGLEATVLSPPRRQKSVRVRHEVKG
ncbi:MAG: 2'-5' RNA ligase family protein [Anaerolineae bacterium]|nr:2'-5' RNA ligase family protein [Anaerolineae bacterium]